MLGVSIGQVSCLRPWPSRHIHSFEQCHGYPSVQHKSKNILHLMTGFLVLGPERICQNRYKIHIGLRIMYHLFLATQLNMEKF